MTEKSLGEIRFSRELGLWRAISLSLEVMLILLIYVLVGEVVAATGPVAPLAYLLAALLLLANLLGYVELAMSVPRTGGAYVLVHEAQGGGRTEVQIVSPPDSKSSARMSDGIATRLSASKRT